MPLLVSCVASNMSAFPEPDLVPVDEAVSITMEGSCVSIRLPAHVDEMRTHVMVDAVNAAVGAGSVVLLGWVGASTPTPAPIWSPLDGDGSATSCVAVRRAGLIVVRRSAVVWMIDVVQQRFLQSDALLDVCFVPPGAWRSYRALWISASAISVLTLEDTYVTSGRSSSDGSMSETRVGIVDADRVA